MLREDVPQAAPGAITVAFTGAGFHLRLNIAGIPSRVVWLG